MPVEICEATIKDFDVIYDFINQLENTVFEKSQQEKIYRANLQNKNIIYLMAFENSTAIGFVSCHAQQLLHHSGLIGEIQEMFVDQTQRSSGVGKLLMERLKSISKEKGILQLEVTSNKIRNEAHRFYLKEGFGETHFKFTLPL